MRKCNLELHSFTFAVSDTTAQVEFKQLCELNAVLQKQKKENLNVDMNMLNRHFCHLMDFCHLMV